MPVLMDEATTYLASVVGVNRDGYYRHQAILLRHLPTRADAEDLAVDRFSEDCPGYAVRNVVVSAFSELAHVWRPSVWAPVPPPPQVKKRRVQIQMRPWCFLLGVYWEPSNKTLHICPLPCIQIALVF